MVSKKEQEKGYYLNPVDISKTKRYRTSRVRLYNFLANLRVQMLHEMARPASQIHDRFKTSLNVLGQDRGAPLQHVCYTQRLKCDFVYELIPTSNLSTRRSAISSLI